MRNKISNNDLPIITSNYKIIIEDEYPIMYIGNNKEQDYIIGLLLTHNKNSNFYIHTILNKNQFNKYVNKYKNLRIIMEENGILYIVQFDNNNIVQNIFKLPINHINDKYLPWYSSGYSISDKILPSIN